LIVPL